MALCRCGLAGVGQLGLPGLISALSYRLDIVLKTVGFAGHVHIFLVTSTMALRDITIPLDQSYADMPVLLLRTLNISRMLLWLIDTRLI